MGYIKVSISNNEKVKVCEELVMQIEMIILNRHHMIVINETSRQHINTVLKRESQ